MDYNPSSGRRGRELQALKLPQSALKKKTQDEQFVKYLKHATTLKLCAFGFL